MVNKASVAKSVLFGAFYLFGLAIMWSIDFIKNYLSLIAYLAWFFLSRWIFQIIVNVIESRKNRL